MRVTYDQATHTPLSMSMLKPFDMHQHLRQGDMLALVAPMVAKRFAGAIIMPNTTPPITTVAMASDYRCEIDMINGPDFLPLMTMYLTDSINLAEVERACSEDIIAGIKYYPAGLTTNSDSGVKDPSALWTAGTRPYECLRALAEHDGVLLLHAADGIASDNCSIGGRAYAAGDMLDPYDQELHFIAFTLDRIREAHPNLKISVEHLSTLQGVEYLRRHGGKRLGCSLTAQHLLLDRRDSFRKGAQMGFNPHRFWWPIIQPKEHRDALRAFAAEGHPFVWLGSDSAPHPVGKKLADCCTGGVLMAHLGIEIYAEAFEDMGALDDRFERFASLNGPAFYGVEPSEEQITLVREEWKPDMFWFGEATSEAGVKERLVPFRLGEPVRWKLAA
jgi:dihydroorotase